MRNSASMRRRARVTGCRPPGCWPRPGCVTSMRPAASCARVRPARASPAAPASCAARSSRAALMRAPASRRSSGAMPPSALSSAVIAPFLPNNSTLSASSAPRSALAAMRARASAASWSRSVGGWSVMGLSLASEGDSPHAGTVPEKEAGPLARPGLVWSLGTGPRPAPRVHQVPRLALACSAILPNASMSWTARSASILRSISMPAAFRPAIMRL